MAKRRKQCARLLPLPAAYKVVSMAAFELEEEDAKRSSHKELRSDWLCIRIPYLAPGVSDGFRLAQMKLKQPVFRDAVLTYPLGEAPLS